MSSEAQRGSEGWVLEVCRRESRVECSHRRRLELRCAECHVRIQCCLRETVIHLPETHVPSRSAVVDTSMKNLQGESEKSEKWES